MIECVNCGFYDYDIWGCCTCPPQDKWYACPIESAKPENIQALKEYVEQQTYPQGYPHQIVHKPS